MTAPRCTVCDDTGEVGQLGLLDCKACTAAETRMRLNAHMAFALHMPVADRDWVVFQYAQSLAAGVVRDYVEPEPVAWIVFAEDHNGMTPQFPAYGAKIHATRAASVFGQTSTEVRPLYAAPAAAPLPEAGSAAPDGEVERECTHEMLCAAMRAAVKHKIIASHADGETYLKNWDGMKEVIRAAIAATKE